MSMSRDETRPGARSRAGSAGGYPRLKHQEEYQIAPDETTTSLDRAKSATWKFDFADTVQADPKANGYCLAVIRVYLHFASKSRPQAFCSLPELMLRTGGSRSAVRRAKALLEQLGYLVPKYETDQGATLYQLVNSRKQLVDDHLRISRETLAEEKRDHKRRERRRVAQLGGIEMITPEIDSWDRNDHPVGIETIPNTVEEHPRVSSFEERENSLRDQFAPNSDAYAAAQDDDPTIPFSVPDDDSEAAEILARFGNVHPMVRQQLHKMLMAGELTPGFLNVNLGGQRER